MVNVAVKDESPATETLLPVTPLPLMLKVGVPAAPPVNPDPLIVTWTVVPLTPLAGEIDVIVGVDETTENCTWLLGPALVVIISTA